MKYSTHRLFVGAAILLLAALAGMLRFHGLSNDESADLSMQAAAPALQWQRESAQQYDVLIDSSFRMAMTGADSAQSMRVRVAAILEFRILEVRAQEVLVGMRFSSIEMRVAGVSNPEVNRELSLPFRVRFASSGLPMEFEFPGAVSEDLRGVIENFVRTFQVVMQDGDAWQVPESNASGVYEAAYVRRSPSYVEKAKRGYVGSTSATPDVMPNITSSESIRIDANRNWIAEMRLDETISTSDSNGPSVEVRNHASLALRSDSAADTAAQPDLWNFAATTSPDRANRARAVAPAVSPEQAKKQLLAGLAALDVAGEGRSRWIHRLSDLIVVDQTLPFILLEAMRGQELSDETRADLYLVLQLAGSSDAQAALGSVVADTSWSTQDALRAVVALGGVTNPTPDTLSVLWNATIGGQAGGDRRHLATTAALALGRLGRVLHAADDTYYSSLRTDLLNGAFSAASPHQRSVYLHALGNTADASLQSDIVPLLNDAAPRIRGAAALTLGRLGTNAVAADLLRRFEQENSSVVRGAIAEALVSWEDPSRAAVALMRAAVREETDENARYYMAQFLGRNLVAFPENNVVLKDVLRSEQSKRIRLEVVEMLAAAKSTSRLRSSSRALD